MVKGIGQTGNGPAGWQRRRFAIYEVLWGLVIPSLVHTYSFTARVR